MTNQQQETSPTRTPGQAEGVRDAEPQGNSTPSAPAPTPSQAEGDRETVEADLREKGLDR